MENKRKIITILLIVTILVVAILFVFKFSNHSNVSSNGTKAIKELEKLQKQKATYIIFVGASGKSIKDNSVINTLENKYKELKIVKFDYSQQNLPGLKSVLDAHNITDELKKQSYMLLFKNGSYVGGFYNVSNYDNVLNYLYLKEMLKKPIITEETNFNQFVSDKNKKYLLIFVATDEHVKMVNNHKDKFSSLVKYNIVNIKNTEGSKIYKNVRDKYKIEPIVPQAVYFENSKLVKSYLLADFEDVYLEIKADLEKRQN